MTDPVNTNARTEQPQAHARIPADSARIPRAGALLSLLLTLHAPSRATETDPGTWPGWRGPGRDGQVTGAVWPASPEALEKAWSVPLGPSYSGPVLSRTAVFVTETVDAQREVVRALDRKTGRELWRASWDGALSVPFFAASNGSWIRATPWYDGERLYVAGMRDVLVCLEAETGKEVWRVDFVERFKTPLPAFGFVSSPLVTDDHVYVQAGAALVKLDKRTGGTLWRTLDDGGGMYGSAFSSPVFATLGGRLQLLVQTREKLAGVDPESGGVLWSKEVPAFRGMNILTPTVLGDRIFTSAYGGGTRLLRVSAKDAAGKSQQGDQDKDKGEGVGVGEDKANDKDGANDTTTSPKAKNEAVDRASFVVEQLWEDSAQGYMSSPVVIDGHAYLHMRNQRMTSFLLGSDEAKRAWTSTERYGKYLSLVAQGERILALDERGVLILLKASAGALETIATRTVSEESSWAHLAVAGRDVVVRDLGAVTLYKSREE